MTPALAPERDVATLPAATPSRPPSMETVTPLREALGLSADLDPAYVLQAQALADAYPHSSLALARLAQAAQSVGDRDRACAAARAAIRAAGGAREGASSHSRHAAALVLAANGAEDASQALAQDPSAGAAVIRASLAVESGDIGAAIKELDEADGAMARAMQGWLLLPTEPAKGVTALRAAVREGLRSPDVLVNLGCGLAALGSLRKAIRVTREATALSPGDVNAAYNLSLYLNHDGRNDEALAELDRIARVRPDEAGLALRRAWAHVHFADDATAALRHLKEARERLRFTGTVQASAEVEASIAFLELKLGQRSAASAKTALWKRLPSSGPSPEVVLMLAAVLGEPSDVPELTRLLREAGHALSVSQRAVQESRLDALQERIPDAVGHALLAVAADADNAGVLGHALSLIGESAGDYQAAAELASRYRKRVVEPRLANDMALVLALAGQPDRAVAVIREAGGARALPFGGATAALVDLAAGRIEAGLKGYADAIRKVRGVGDPELADLIDWRRRLAMLQLGVPLPDGEDAAEPSGTGHAAARQMLKRVKSRLAGTA